MPPTVEPHVVEGDAQRRVGEQLGDAADVIGVDVRDDEQVEVTLARRQLSDALLDEARGLPHAGVDEHAVRAARRAVFDEQGITLLGRQHLDAEHD